MKTETFVKYATVVLDLALDKPLEYGIPVELEAKIKRGVRVQVPVRGHLRAGFIHEVKDSAEFAHVLPIAKVISEEELITPDLYQLAVWMAKYYCTPLRQVLKIILPATVRKDTKHKQQQF